MRILLFYILLLTTHKVAGQIDSTLIRRTAKDSTGLSLNMDAVYNRPFLTVGKFPVALGGYLEANYQHIGTDGITEGHQFQMRRLTLFVASGIYKRIKFLSEIEFEDGTKEINIEFAALDIEFHPLLNLRGGIVMNPIGAFNQNHDGPKWEFVDRPMSATQLLPATWSNVGFGIYGKQYSEQWVFAYEAYLTNGFNERIIDNPIGRSSLPAAKVNSERFEESFNGVPLITGKVAVRKSRLAEVGISYMGGVYNKFEDDGLILDRRRRVDVFALDMNTTLPRINTFINGEWSWILIDVPGRYSQQYGSQQQGGFMDIIQPVYQGNVFGFERSTLNLACRFEYVDWNTGTFNETRGPIADDFISVIPAISWRPTVQTVLRLNYRYNWSRDILGNPATRTAGVQFGISSYF